MVKEFKIAQMARMHFGIGMGLNLQFSEDGEDGGIECAWEAPRASLPKEESSFLHGARCTYNSLSSSVFFSLSCRDVVKATHNDLCTLCFFTRFGAKAWETWSKEHVDPCT